MSGTTTGEQAHNMKPTNSALVARSQVRITSPGGRDSPVGHPTAAGFDVDGVETSPLEHLPHLHTGVAMLQRSREAIELIVDEHPERIVGVCLQRERVHDPVA